MNSRIEIPARSGKAAFVASGQAVTVINTHGEQVVDTWAFNRADLTEFMSNEHTRAHSLHLVPRPGDVLRTNRRRAILTFVEDTSGDINDTLIQACRPNEKSPRPIAGDTRNSARRARRRCRRTCPRPTALDGAPIPTGSRDQPRGGSGRLVCDVRLRRGEALRIIDDKGLSSRVADRLARGGYVGADQLRRYRQGAVERRHFERQGYPVGYGTRVPLADRGHERRARSAGRRFHAGFDGRGLRRGDAQYP